MGGEAALEVGRAPLRELSGEPLRVARRGARPVAELRRAGQAEPPGEVGVQRPEGLDGLGAVLHQTDPVSRQLGVPRVERGRAGRAGAYTRDERVPLSERARVGRSRIRTAWPQGRHELVQVGAAARGRALYQLE